MLKPDFHEPVDSIPYHSGSVNMKTHCNFLAIQGEGLLFAQFAHRSNSRTLELWMSFCSLFSLKYASQIVLSSPFLPLMSHPLLSRSRPLDELLQPANVCMSGHFLRSSSSFDLVRYKARVCHGDERLAGLAEHSGHRKPCQNRSLPPWSFLEPRPRKQHSLKVTLFPFPLKLSLP